MRIRERLHTLLSPLAGPRREQGRSGTSATTSPADPALAAASTPDQLSASEAALMRAVEAQLHDADFDGAMKSLADVAHTSPLLSFKLRTIRDIELRRPSVTAILTGYRRPQNILKQISALRAQTRPVADVWLWYNYGGDDKPMVYPEGVRSAHSNYNFKFYSRFAYAMLATTRYVAIFDDDTIPGPRWIENCLATIETHPGIIGAAGMRLHRRDDYRPHTRFGWSSMNTGVERVDLLGQTWFLERDVLRYMWAERPLTWDNGEDIHLSYTAKKYGGINTYVAPHPPGEKELWGSVSGEIGNDEESMWVNRAINGHEHLRRQIIRHNIANGWTLCLDDE